MHHFRAVAEFAYRPEYCSAKINDRREVKKRLLAALALLSVRGAAAEPTPQALTFRYSPYEDAAISNAERTLGAIVDSAPEGKLIETIEFVRLDPIEPRDPMPAWLNAAHVRTRESVIARELLTRAGDVYRKVSVEESARRLRALPQLTLVVCIAFRGSSPDRVRLVVITKDVWSLFFDVDWAASNGGFSKLMIAPQESNLLGLHHKLAAEFNWNPYAYALGGRYEIPHFDHSPINLLTDANVIVGHRETHTVEGSFGKVQAILPLRSDRQRVSWFSSFDWRDEQTRAFSGAELARAHDIEQVWRTVHARALAAQTHSFGWKYKQDLSWFFSAERSQYRLPSSVRSATDPDAARVRLAEIVLFETDRLPTSYATVGPGLEWHAYTSDFLRTYELETLGLQEDYRLGHSLVLNVLPGYHVEQRGYQGLPEQATYRAVQLGFYAAVQETLPVRDGFVRAAVDLGGSVGARSIVSGPRASDASIRESLFASSTLRNSALRARVRLASPRLGFGRLVTDALFTMRWHDALNVSQRYDNASRLRGYDNVYVHGKDTLAANIEYRSPAWQLSTEQVGAAIFYDLAAAETNPGSEPDLHSLNARSALGVGIRVVTPLLERAGIRLDLALPLDRSASPFPGDEGARVSAYAISFAFGQAFEVGDVNLTTPP